MIHCVQIVNKKYKILIQSFSSIEEDFPNSDETFNKLRSSLTSVIDSGGPGPFIVNIDKYSCFIFKKDHFFQIIADKNELKDKISLFFEEIHSEFLKVNTSENTNFAAFENKLCLKIKEFNKKDSLKELESNLEGVKNICYESLNVVTKRGEKLETLSEIASDLEAQVRIFQKNVKDSFSQGFWQKYFVPLFCLLILFLIILKYYYF
ncbi:Vesicle-associated membrane protein 8 [Cucumispora dikerogammari]|nr:Vesicle-associated membrane protein 8 [Cucumispora dikerogammari]